MECVLKHQDLQFFRSQINTNMSIFHPSDAVGRGSETQLQVDENLKYLI